MAAGIIGNMLEWYEFALYGFMASILSKVFFPAEDPLISLIAAYGVFAVGIRRPDTDAGQLTDADHRDEYRTGRHADRCRAPAMFGLGGMHDASRSLLCTTCTVSVHHAMTTAGRGRYEDRGKR